MQAASGGGGEYERGGVKFIFKIVSVNALQAILKPSFPYSITSILSKVRHANASFLTICVAFTCRPLGALVRFPCGGGGGTAIAMQV